MRKKIICITLLSLLTICLVNKKIYSVNSNTINNPEIIEEKINVDGTKTFKYNDGTILVVENKNYRLMIPESVMSNFPEHNVKSVIGTVTVILGKVALACSVIDWFTDIDPCKIAARYLVNALGSNAVSGKYIVKQHHQPGYIPGCEPRHSLYCNSGHTEYVFERVDD